MRNEYASAWLGCMYDQNAPPEYYIGKYITL